MKKYFLMAIVAVAMMTQFADAGVFARLRARRQGRITRPAAAAPATPATPAPAAATPAPAPAPAPSK